MFCCLLGLLLGNGDLAPRKSSGPLPPARRSRGALRWHERSEGRVDRIRLSAGTCRRSKTAYRPACVARPDTIGCVAHESETNSHCKRRLCERIVPPTQIEYATGGAFSNVPSSSRMGVSPKAAG